MNMREHEVEMAKAAKDDILSGRIMKNATQKEIADALAICETGINGDYTTK